MTVFSDVRVCLPRRARVGKGTDHFNEGKSTRQRKIQGTCSSATFKFLNFITFCCLLFSGIVCRDILDDIIPLIGMALKHAQHSSGKVLFFFSVVRTARVSRQMI